jgi:hypothetical protein
MIRKLRTRHLRWMIALAVLIPAGMIAGLAARPNFLINDPLPEAFWRSNRHFGRSIGSTTPIQLTGVSLDLAVVVDAGRKAIQVSNPLETDMPEALFYYSREKPDMAEDLPQNATLLGELGRAKSTVWDLPADAAAGKGFVIVYSLGHDEILAWGALEPPKEAREKKG